MSFGIEEYYHAQVFAKALDRAAWTDMPSRVSRSTYTLLDMLAQANAKATFFTLGIVARDHKPLIRRMVAEGHELASHGWAHQPVYEQSRAEFRKDVADAKAVIEDVAGVAVRGYRAPTFSFNADTPWAYEVLAETGYVYSSSAHPIAHDAYGDPNAPRKPHYPDRAEIVEIPITTIELFGKRRPCGGGGFFRLLPRAWFAFAARRAISQLGSANFYLHPWEIDPDQPHIKGVGVRSTLRHRIGMSGCARKLERHLDAFTWGRMDEVYGDWLDCASEFRNDAHADEPAHAEAV